MITLFCLLAYGKCPFQMDIPQWAVMLSICVDILFILVLELYQRVDR